MSEAKHTPGPWIPERNGKVRGDGGRLVLSVGAFHECPSAEANRALIAAAPDLLAACELFDGAGQDELDGIVRTGGVDIWDTLRAAIAKAKGQ